MKKSCCLLLTNRKTKVFMLTIIMIFIFIFKTVKKDYLPINSIIQEMFQYLEIKNCYVTSMEDYDDISIELVKPIITEKDIDEYINDFLNECDENKITIKLVKRKTNFNSLDEFYDYVDKKVNASKELEILIEARSNIMDKMIGKSKFSLDKNIVAEYSLEAVQAYEEIAHTI